jgi:hypothetical protein
MSSIEKIGIINKTSGESEQYDLAIDSNNITDKGQPNGIAELDSYGKVPLEQLPISFATTASAGIVKPDGVTITVEADGTIHGNNQINIDDALSETSTNPVQNRVITSTLNQVVPTTKGGTGNSLGYIQSGALDGTTPHIRATVEGGQNTGTGPDSHCEG